MYLWNATLPTVARDDDRHTFSSLLFFLLSLSVSPFVSAPEGSKLDFSVGRKVRVLKVIKDAS
ncbi:MAG: hypothetical protein FJX71_01645 [Alphaproteobacteria bacterium]|nr:hypothetical protein [Alphaproteobacteria bacterium]